MPDDGSKPFVIRLGGAAPAPPTTAKKGGPGGRKKAKAAAPPPQQQRHTVTIHPEQTTVSDLRREAHRLFGVGDGFDVVLLTGYPPRKIECGNDDTLAKIVVRPSESVIVRFEESAVRSSSATATATAAKKGGGSPKMPPAPGIKKRPRASASSASAVEADSDDEKGGTGGESSGEAVGGGRRPRRAAAEAASASFSDVIRAQDALMRSDPSPTKKKSKTARGAISVGGESGRGGSKKKVASSSASSSTTGVGRRLADGAVVGCPTPSSRQRSSPTRSRGGPTMKNKDDVSYHLLASLESGGSGGKVGRFLRSAMRGAVGKTYEQSRAVVRVDAVRAGKYAIQAKENVAVLGGGEIDRERKLVGVCTVEYSKGLEGRGNYTEDVEIIAAEALSEVVRAVYKDSSSTGGDGNDEEKGAEMLRPVNMAQLSPRVFWSLAHHHLNGAPGTIEAALKLAAPDLDWSFLGGRTKTLSDKAKENLRQEKVRRGEIEDEDMEEKHFETAVGAVEAVEKAMETMASHDRENARERAARAAMARFGESAAPTGGNGAGSPLESVKLENNREAKEWKLLTPSEIDTDELRECILEGMEAASVSIGWSEGVDKLVNALVSACSVRNWRELANADAALLASKLGACDSCSALCTESNIERWIESAHSRSLDEIMLEILDGNDDVYAALRDEARAGTPKDLSFWESMPSMLLAAAPSLGGLTLSADSKENVGERTVGEADVARWCRKARSVLDAFDWLSWYATPVA